jgi:hypothetical protein
MRNNGAYELKNKIILVTRFGISLKREVKLVGLDSVSL